MVGLSGLEKFSHLEDKIYRTIRAYQDPASGEGEPGKGAFAHAAQSRVSNSNEQLRLEKQVEALLAERDIIRSKVEAMLDAVAALDPEMAEELR